MAKLVAKMPDALKDVDVQGLFNQLSGVSAADLDIIYPKYIEMKRNGEKIMKILSIVDGVFSLPGIKEFIEAEDKIDMEIDLHKQTEEMSNKFHEAYTAYKKSSTVRNFIKICDNLASYKNELASVNFIITSAKADWFIFPFCDVNFKNLLISKNESEQRLFAGSLQKIFDLSYKIYQAVSSPDVDLDKLIMVLKSSIAEVKKRPELNRCTAAFKKIEDSIHLLKNNFNTYYKDFLQSGNSSIIMEHFVLDVSKNTKTDPVLASQFKIIMNYYRNMSEKLGKNKDPKIQKLYDILGANIDMLDKDSKNIKKMPDI